jgi:hypothetical protein
LHRYAEVLEHTQLALIATVQKLYSMVQNHQSWDLGEPEINDRGQPVIHDIASRLGCIRPNSDIDLPVQSVFPETEAECNQLASQLEAYQHEDYSHQEDEQMPQVPPPPQQQQQDPAYSQQLRVKTDTRRRYQRDDRASSSEFDHSDFEDYRRAAFGGGNGALSASPQSFMGNDFETTTPSDAFSMSPAIATPFSSGVPYYGLPANLPAYLASLQAAGGAAPMDLDLLNQGLLENNFGTLERHYRAGPKPEVMMGVGDPMFSAYPGDPNML